MNKVIKKFILLLLVAIFFCSNFNVLAFDFKVYSQNIYLLNLNDNEVVYEKDADEKIYIASLTKIMTAIVAIENIKDLNEKITISKSLYKQIPSNASVTDLKIGDVVSYLDLLYGALLPSGADAVMGLAIKVSGSEKEFVKLMNKKAQDLGLKNTNYVNATGLDAKNHYSSVKDVATLLLYALNNKTFKKIYSTREYITTNDVIMKSTFKYMTEQTNETYDFIYGSKTGSTKKAGLCISSIGGNKNINFLLVTAGAPYVYTNRVKHILDTVNIYNYYFDNYAYKRVLNKGDVITELDSIYTSKDKLVINSKVDVNKYLPKNIKKEDIKYEYDGMEEVSYKTKNGTKLGTYKILYKDNILYQEDIYLEKALTFNFFSFFKANPFVLIISILILIIIFALFKLKRKKRRRH